MDLQAEAIDAQDTTGVSPNVNAFFTSSHLLSVTLAISLSLGCSLLFLPF